jgi:hypothetical protein
LAFGLCGALDFFPFRLPVGLRLGIGAKHRHQRDCECNEGREERLEKVHHEGENT